MDMHLAKVLKAHNQPGLGDSLRILEINADHALVKALAQKSTAEGHSDVVEDAAGLLFDQARIIEGEPVEDPVAFATRMADFMTKGLSA